MNIINLLQQLASSAHHQLPTNKLLNRLPAEFKLNLIKKESYDKNGCPSTKNAVTNFDHMFVIHA